MHNVLMITNYNNHSRLTLDNGEYLIIEKKPLNLIKELCLLNGSSFEGRISAFKYLTSTRQKPCIMIRKNLIYMPTISFNNPECEYILYNRIVWIRQEDYQSLVLFDNGCKLVVNSSYRTLRKQLKRCDLFKEKLISRCSIKVNELF